MLQTKILPTRAGIYLGLFALGLLVSASFTGTNMLLLLDFFLFALISFNFIYLNKLKEITLNFKLPSHFVEEEVLKLQFVNEKNLAFSGNLRLIYERFAKRGEILAQISSWQGYETVILEPFKIRGNYLFKELILEVDFPLKLFCLTIKKNFLATCLVAPKPISNQPIDLKQINSLKGGDLDFLGLRPYQNGDSLAKVSWKHFAKSEKLLLKLFDEGHFIVQEQKDIALVYDSQNEKVYFQSILAYFLALIEYNIDFSIVGKHGKYQKYEGQKKLLNYLAAYEKIN